MSKPQATRRWQSPFLGYGLVVLAVLLAQWSLTATSVLLALALFVGCCQVFLVQSRGVSSWLQIVGRATLFTALAAPVAVGSMWLFYTLLVAIS